MPSYRGIDYQVMRGRHVDAYLSAGPLLWHGVFQVRGEAGFILNRRSLKDLIAKVEHEIDQRLLPKPPRITKRSIRIDKLSRMTVENGCTPAEADIAASKLRRMRA
jgi:hypothetical protein